MKKLFFMAALLATVYANGQQIKGASLVASGLTCSMCSKAVLKSLQAVPFVEAVQADIKSQQYNISFKEGAAVDFDALSKAVRDAGFSVASLKVNAVVDGITLQKDEHLNIGNLNFHFLNGASKTLNGLITISVVDKSFVSKEDFKKWSVLTAMPCVQTGRMSGCCTKNETAVSTRIYHVVI